MADKMYVGDVGTIITVDCGEALTGATTTNLLVKKPGGSIVTWSAAIYNTNYLRYTIQVNDLDENGVYHLQAYVIMPSWTGRGETDQFTVYDPYE